MKKVLFLFVALLLPAVIFVFLKMFGKNKVDVLPLYSEEYPAGVEDCGVRIALPYTIPDTLQARFQMKQNNLTLLYFGSVENDPEKQINRIKRDFKNDVNLQMLTDSAGSEQLKRCIFFLSGSQDLVLLDQNGAIRGQYVSTERKEMDRLVTELSILLKQY
jgi:hypothetical protein